VCVCFPPAMSALAIVAAASRDAPPRGSDATVHSFASVAAAAGTTMAAAVGAVLPPAASPPGAPLAQELAAVKQRIAVVEEEITAVEAELVATKKARDACPLGSELRKEHTAELERLGRKVERLGSEKERLGRKEERLCDELKRKELAQEQAVTQQFQQLQIADQQRQQQELNRRLNLVRRGFPPLGDHVCSSSSAAQSKLHPEAQLMESSFACFADPAGPNSPPWLVPPPLGSDVWNTLENSSPPATRLSAWSSESDIHGCVKGALLDVIKHSGLNCQVSLLNEVSIFHSAKQQQQRADIWVVRDGSGFPIGVCEVKKPNGAKAASALSHPALHGQIFDYMVNLRNFFGLKRVFGIVSTYEEWRICWLADSDEAARETDAAAYVRQAQAAESRDVAHIREVYATPIMRYDDPDLVRLLVHLMHKMHLSPYDASPRLVKKGQRYPLFSETAWDWTPLSADFRLSYCMPHANTKNFYLLQQYHGGADGLVWLAASAQGNLVVLKFGLVGDRRDVRQFLEAEAQHWNQLWACKARVIQLFHRLVLVMPFAFHAHLSASPQRALTFKGPNNWTTMLPDAEVAQRAASKQSGIEDVVSEDGEVLPLLARFLEQHSPDWIAEAAITAMLSCNVMHDDLCWRHIAILPCQSGSQWTLRPVLIDLTRVRPIRTAQREIPPAGAVVSADANDNRGDEGAAQAGSAPSEEDKALELQAAMELLKEELQRSA